MNRIVAVPNWSFFDPIRCDQARSLVIGLGLTPHYFRGDIDHQRTVTAFSGQQNEVFESLASLAKVLLPLIDLRLSRGVHPRVGALDVAPFVLIEGSESVLIEATVKWAAEFSESFDIPVHLYEKAAREGQEYRLPYLRGQVGELEQLPDFGSLKNPRWGKTIVGVRDFLLAANLNLASDDLIGVRQVAKEMRLMRERGRAELNGVRALGFELNSRGMTQLSLNFTDPDSTTFDVVYEIASQLLAEVPIYVAETELIGVIRERDLAGATQLTIDPSQVVR